jgi:hypothetical protein
MKGPAAMLQATVNLALQSGADADRIYNDGAQAEQLGHAYTPFLGSLSSPTTAGCFCRAAAGGSFRREQL